MNTRINSLKFLVYGLALFALPIISSLAAEEAVPRIQEYPIPASSHPHDVTPATDGSVWYTGQASGELGRLDTNSLPSANAQVRQLLGRHGEVWGPSREPTSSS